MADAPTMEPANIDAEREVLGSCLHHADSIITMASKLTPNDFMFEKHALIFQAMLDLYEQRSPCSSIGLVVDQLERNGTLERAGGYTTLTEFRFEALTWEYAEHYADLVREASVRRKFLRAAEQFAALAYDRSITPAELAGKAQSILGNVSADVTAAGWVPMERAMNEAFDWFGEQSASPFTLGFPEFDDRFGGFERGHLILIAARPSVGKSALATQVALHQALNCGHKVGIISLEMSYKEIAKRLIQLQSQVNLHTYRLRAWTDETEEQQIMKSIGQLFKIPLLINDHTGGQLDSALAQMRQLHAKAGAELFIVDYLQLLEADKKSQNRVQDVGKISSALKNIARELNVPVIALSQLNRAIEIRRPAVPILADLRDSGSLEQDADVVIFINRPDKYDEAAPKNVAQLIVSKFRDGPTGEITVQWDPERAQFKDSGQRPA